MLIITKSYFNYTIVLIETILKIVQKNIDIKLENKMFHNIIPSSPGSSQHTPRKN